MKLKLFTSIALLLLPLMLVAQGRVTVSGTVTDKNTGEPLPSATVSIAPSSDKETKKYTSTDLDGKFTFTSVSYDSYVLGVTYVGYKADEKRLKVTDKKDNYIVTFKLEENALMLGEVSVQGRATRAEQKGDSLFYNAEAFKVMQGSSAEDLLSKMPGIVVEGGTIQAQGENVKKILVDGKEFFEGDVNLAIKNLPSDIIASIEVFDKKSDQAEFTGFDDGEEIKTINIVTKTGFSSGTFGNLYGGYGTDNRYKVGGNVNYFDGDRRISVLGMSNNVNNQNFSQEVINVICNYRGNIVAGKRIMKLIGLDLGKNRTPFQNMTDDEEARMKAQLDAIGFFDRCNRF